MQDFIDENFKGLLEANSIESFAELWSLPLESVDVPNRARGGWSEVFRLLLKDADGCEQLFYIKRQCNYLTRSWRTPFGEPTLAKEFRNILHYRACDIPALDAVYYAERKLDEGRAAILITPDLRSFAPLSDKLPRWARLAETERLAIIDAVAVAIAKLHRCRLVHRCCYPKHLYLQQGEAGFAVKFIDLEKTGYSFRPYRDAIVDLEALVRRCDCWSDMEVERLVRSYLAEHRLGLTERGVLMRLRQRLQRKQGRN